MLIFVTKESFPLEVIGFPDTFGDIYNYHERSLCIIKYKYFMSQIEVINRVFEDKLNHTELKGFIIVMSWMINSIIEIC